MSYEVIFKYHEEGSEKGQYNKDVVKEKVMKIGKPFEEVPLEDVASRIIAQLARRNILVVDVEVYEYCKKKINYHEADDGIKIRGRKFCFDGSVKFEAGKDIDVTEEEPLEEEDQLAKVLKQNPILAKQLSGAKNAASLTPIRKEIFDPDQVPPPGSVGSMRQGWKFTRGRLYPILKEKPAGTNPLAGMLYTTTDDGGQLVELSDKYFTIPTRLTGTFEDDAQYVGAGVEEPKLTFANELKSNMPDLSQLRGR